MNEWIVIIALSHYHQNFFISSSPIFFALATDSELLGSMSYSDIWGKTTSSPTGTTSGF